MVCLDLKPQPHDGRRRRYHGKVSFYHTSVLLAFIWITNFQRASPQTKSCRCPTYNLLTITVCNQDKARLEPTYITREVKGPHGDLLISNSIQNACFKRVENVSHCKIFSLLLPTYLHDEQNASQLRDENLILTSSSLQTLSASP